ncbi:MAG: hypothetical protein U5Q44_12830 [Dehalococcoidia bacterium]|nr:hypothetical protein [Dehalococcoidia bacterium]
MTGLSAKLRDLIASTDDDAATQDLYVEVQRGIDKRAWMLDAHVR